MQHTKFAVAVFGWLLRLQQSVAQPNIFRRPQLVTSFLQSENVFSDPNYSQQEWVFDMINVERAWRAGYLGKGVRVRVNDDGVDNVNNTEFAGRFDESGSCDRYLPESDEDDHGTRVASILGAAGNNGECAVGVAPEVTLSSCYAFGDTSYEILSEKVDSFDISQNSWGVKACTWDGFDRRNLQRVKECPFRYRDPYRTFPCAVCDFSSRSDECEEAIIDHCWYNYERDVGGCIEFLDLYLSDGLCFFNILDDLARRSIITGIRDGRDGKGIIYVFSSGNEFDSGTDTNYSGLTNSRFIISVGAVGKDGLRGSYSNPGASLFVAAPGGDSETSPNLYGMRLGGECGDTGYGTSFSAPVVSGVIALMLEANPLLSWRDVQGILARTSRPVRDRRDASASTNAAGIWHSNLYGFGMVDAYRAVLAAKSWHLFGPENILVGQSGVVNRPIVDDASNAMFSAVQLRSRSRRRDFIAESVAVYLDVQHMSRGHLEVVLKSPRGTESVLLPGSRPENTVLEEGEAWKVLTVRNWGESAIGTWSLRIRDLKDGDVSDCADLPFFPFYDGFDWNCWDLDDCGVCFGGMAATNATTAVEEDFFQLKYNGRTAEEACCSCGGGVGEGDFVERLVKWRIVVFGREARRRRRRFRGAARR